MDDHELRVRLDEIRGAVRSIARRYPPQEFEDLVSVGMTAAWQALVRGTESPQHLITRARWAMQDYLRVVRPDKRAKRLRRGGDPVVLMSLDAITDATDFEPEDKRPRTDELCIEHERALELEARLKRLPKRLRYVVRRRLRGWTSVVIAKKLGVTEPRVSQLITEAVRLLRGYGER